VEEDWEEFAMKNKMAAEKVITGAQQLRAKMESLLRQTYQDIEQQVAVTDMAIERRLRELHAIKNKLQSQLCDVILYYGP
jgi:hypothetical protein